jgi:DNA-directed RNA polymerase specialized sigma24 family protein
MQGGARDDESSLDALMARLADGDRAAFDPLFRAFHPRAVRLARLRLSDADALDAAQSALENVFARASEFTAGRPALPWFYAVVANEVQAIARRQGVATRRDAGPEAIDAASAPGDPEGDLTRAELRAALAAAIDALDPVSASAIAGLLGDAPPLPVSPAASRKRVSRAYARLRQLLERFHDH